MDECKMPRRVVVTGYGAVSSLGENSHEIWGNILEKKLGYRRHDTGDVSIKARYFAFMETNPARYRKFPKSLLKTLPQFAKNGMLATHEALAMAFGVDAQLDEVYDPFERGVIIGTGWGGHDSANANNNTYQQTGFSSSFSTIQSMHSSATAAISIQWRLRGYQNTSVAACASGAIAIGDAVEIIRSGRAQMMVAGGSESLRDRFNVWSIDVIQALSKEEETADRACCPFSADRSGFVLAEGAAVVCLEEYECARRRGAKILGEITGYGSFSDAEDMTAPAVDLEARVRTIEAALRQSGRTPESVQYVNAHGTSTPLNDLNESEAIKAALKTHASRVPISSTKSYTGHLIGAAGALETILCLKAIEHRLVPATANLRRPDPRCDLDYTPNDHRPLDTLDVALNLSFGFGGANAALVIERAKLD